jgi:hypothetical protein
MTRLVSIVALVAALAGCGGPMSQETRADITAQMFVAQQPIAACYTTALEGNRRLRGLLVVEMIAAPSTGQFSNIAIVHDELRSQPIRECVVAELGKLRLAKPKKSAVKIKYPLRFAPNK